MRMETAPILLSGHLGVLARRSAELLERRGCRVKLLEAGEKPARLRDIGPSRLLHFPFPPRFAAPAGRRLESDLAWWESLLQEAAGAGLSRIVLRSHGMAYGSSWKNYGLMLEDRPCLLPDHALDRRWVEAEKRLWKAGERASFSTAVLRLTSVLAPEEGDFVTHLFTRRVVFPLAGYDPRVQFLSLEDAADALVAAVLSDAGGLFNVAGEGVVALKAALRASVPVRLPLGRTLQRPLRNLLWRMGLSPFHGDHVDHIRYNWTVSSQRARRELGLKLASGSAQALREFLRGQSRGRPESVLDSEDDYGLDPAYLKVFEPWFFFLRRIYWRVEVDTVENVPASGPALLVSNHRGFMPFDGVIHRSVILEERKRHVRFLVIPSLFKFPFLSDFLIKQGGIVASQHNAEEMFRRGEMVGLFPEGISGAFRMYRGAYRLGAFGRDAFARLAIANGAPIVPAATVGNVEIFPILARVNSSAVTRFTGWPFLPITPTFPLLPVPLPTKWHIRYLEPISVSGFRPQEVENPKRVRELSRHVRAVLQRNIDEMLARRKYIFFGRIFDRPSDSPETESIASEK